MEGPSLDNPPWYAWHMAQPPRGRGLPSWSPYDDQQSPRRKNVLGQLLGMAAAPWINRVCLDRPFLEKGFILSDLLSQNLFATQGPQWD